ncbi:MAG: hypothetical protein ACE15D_19115 [Candidatus Eisenbacteria bacterium]|nr:carboxypeptidase-like regulatory domain-containing protein [Candidatus Eisenbacteria bacterium]
MSSLSFSSRIPAPGPKRRSPFCSLPILLGIAVVMGCSESSPPEPPLLEHSTLYGTVTAVGTQQPVPEAHLVLVDGTRNVVVGGPVVSGADGAYRFVDPPAGTFRVFVFHPEYLVYDRTGSRVTLPELGTIRFDMRMLRSELWNGSGYAIEGRVLDAETREPIWGAFVSGWWGDVAHLFIGAGLPSEAVTDSTGSFRLRHVRLATEDGDTLAILPIGASKEGYDPAASPWLELPEGPDSTAHYDFLLHRSSGTGTIFGSVTLDGQPQPGVPVALDFYDPGWPSEPPPAPRPPAAHASRRVPVAGRVTLTDDEGRWRFDAISPGVYTVLPAYLPDDGYVFDRFKADQVEVGGAEMIDVGALPVVRAIRPLMPAPGSVVNTACPTLSWELPEGSDRVVLGLTTGHLLGEREHLLSGVGSFTLPDSLPAGSHIRWAVYAYRHNELIGAFEEYPTFTVQPEGGTP